MDQHTIEISNMNMRIADLERQNADLQAANNVYLERARKAEAEAKISDDMTAHMLGMMWELEDVVVESPDIIGDVQAFHDGCGTVDPTAPCIPPQHRIDLRIGLISEEVIDELIPAMHANDLVKIADGIADSIYVLVGTALAYGIPLAAVWNEVHRSNLSKFHPDTGKPVRRDDGKILKGEWFSPADIAGVIAIKDAA